MPEDVSPTTTIKRDGIEVSVDQGGTEYVTFPDDTVIADPKEVAALRTFANQHPEVGPTVNQWPELRPASADSRPVDVHLYEKIREFEKELPGPVDVLRFR